MKINICLIVLLILSCCQTSFAAGSKDKRLVPISASQLREAISQTPLESPLQQELLSRGRHANLMGQAYTQYTALWQRQPNNAYANLLRGVSAEYLEWDSMYPGLRKLYEPYIQTSLLPIAASCLKKSVELAPQSPVTNMECGFFLWQFGNELPQGLRLLRKALLLGPHDPRIQATWGMVYANPAVKTHDLQKAKYHLELAVKLDPTYAFPHDILAGVYDDFKQPMKAEQERSKYQSLVSELPHSGQ